MFVFAKEKDGYGAVASSLIQFFSLNGCGSPRIELSDGCRTN